MLGTSEFVPGKIPIDAIGGLSRAILRACPATVRTNMQTPVWTQPALLGAGVGAIAMAVVGFGWGGWVTGGSARDAAAKESTAAIAAVLTPYCLERSQSDPLSIQVLAELKAASSYNRRGIVEKAGWATPLGAEKPNTALAQACQLALAETP